ncbi:iron complex transport system permease protein [Pseudomonas aeruginosa]|uniref:FecCD family ABC transporter permease n=1 Tax=Pseudomonas aeruginosa TaxID=287 RepID=UPI00053D03BD|nr:iron ABC transporter permease [Pseudomonas aeruginosa]EIU7138617.1 iron ABC transporter permease [Pseudomonas aeruginosa]ELX8262537.1 iron ABC transporter permease [Pseudomonas aeruginosa]MBG4362185.1 iron ABC transporter permease [Pseudomonas aeruginosa]MBG6303431.1 iron ABC transporter permease [Pseudomonas aeruginosa]MBH4396564.1 iron ABC transporter permease [Pseudomonas aeruginosa]
MKASVQPTSLRRLYRERVSRRLLYLMVLALASALCLLADLSLGPASHQPGDLLKALWQADLPSAMRVIFWEIRLPVALAALLVGASLAVAGLQMQTVLNNPLASPFTLGLSAAAGFGAALGMILGVTLLPAALVAYAIPANAFLLSMGAALLIHRLSRRRGVKSEMIVLLGTTLVFTFTALLGALQYVAPDQALSAVVFWSMGSLSRVTYPKLALIGGTFLAVYLFFAHRAWALTALGLGEVRATSLGVPVDRLRLQTILLGSLLASACVAFVGTIGFVGLVGPHIARMLIGEDQRFLLPASALCGALLLSAASLASKLLLPGQALPIGIVTSLVGVPLFFLLILRERRY